MGRGRLTSHDIGSMQRLHIYLHELMNFMLFLMWVICANPMWELYLQKCQSDLCWDERICHEFKK